MEKGLESDPGAFIRPCLGQSQSCQSYISIHLAIKEFGCNRYVFTNLIAYLDM